jgi:hypothetical protein
MHYKVVLGVVEGGECIITTLLEMLNRVSAILKVVFTSLAMVCRSVQSFAFI